MLDLVWEDADLLSLSLTELLCPKDRDEIREETATADNWPDLWLDVFAEDWMLGLVSTLDLVPLWGVLNTCEDVNLLVRTLLDLASADANEEWTESDSLCEETTLLFLPGLETAGSFEEWKVLCGWLAIDESLADEGFELWTLLDLTLMVWKDETLDCEDVAFVLCWEPDGEDRTSGKDMIREEAFVKNEWLDETFTSDPRQEWHTFTEEWEIEWTDGRDDGKDRAIAEFKDEWIDEILAEDLWEDWDSWTEEWEIDSEDRMAAVDKIWEDTFVKDDWSDEIFTSDTKQE